MMILFIIKSLILAIIEDFQKARAKKKLAKQRIIKEYSSDPDATR